MATRQLVTPDRFFADRYGLTQSRLEKLLGSTSGRRVDYADIFIEHQVTEELLLEDGVVKKAARTISQGAGVRAQADVRTGYAYTDDLAVEHLEVAARQAQAIAADAGRSAVVPVGGRRDPHDLYALPEA
ncbi:MAG: PmbA/TldA family metallopeptidase, partial [Candidatus Rokuibacteriota bacterium]